MSKEQHIKAIINSAQWEEVIIQIDSLIYEKCEKVRRDAIKKILSIAIPMPEDEERLEALTDEDTYLVIPRKGFNKLLGGDEK
jgi:hypothetical protein